MMETYLGGDGCSALCTNEICGNGIHDNYEECDDGNDINGDGCSSTCTIEDCDNVDQIVVMQAIAARSPNFQKLLGWIPSGSPCDWNGVR